jgi:hypothetical protein
MANLGNRNPLTSVKAITTEEDTMFLVSSRVASLNFDGFIPKDNTFTYASELSVGETIFSSNPTTGDNSFFITKINTDNVDVDGVLETKYFLFYLGENDLEEPYTYDAENEDGSFSQNHLFEVLRDNLSDISVGNNGWMITNQGNAVFSNVFVRGAVEATSGKIDGILTVGDAKDGSPLVTIGKNIFGSSSFEGSSSEHSGIFLNSNNYLMGYEVPLKIPIESIVVTNTTETDFLRKAKFTLAGHTLQVNDLVYLSGFQDDKFLELGESLFVREITENTFTVYYKNEILNTTNPITVNIQAESFALDDTYQITQLELTNESITNELSTAKVYFNNNYTFLFIEELGVELGEIVNTLLPINGEYQVSSVTEVIGQENDYFTVTVPRVTSGTYTTDLGYIILYESNYKFKVGNDTNSMNYNSYTGDLSITGTINANSGNFINTVTVGRSSLSYLVNNKQILDNVAILTTTEDNDFIEGDVVLVDIGDEVFDGTYTITSIPTDRTFTYNKVSENVSSVPVSPVGLVTRGEESDGTIFVGYGDNQITIYGTRDVDILEDPTALPSSIYSGVGEYNNSNTGFYVDSSGRFSLGDQLFFDDGVLTAPGIVTTSLTVGTLPNQMIMSPTAIPGSPSNIPGLYMTKTKDFISATTGNFSLGQNAIVWNGSTLNINGILTGYINQTYAAPVIPANTMGIGFFNNFLNIPGTINGTTLTVLEADRLKLSVGSALTKASGTGVFAAGTTVESILSSTEVIVTPTPTTNGEIVFNSNNASDGVYGAGLKINSYNYWFVADETPGSTPRLKVGDDTNYLEYASGDLTLTGKINALQGGTIGGFEILSDRLVDNTSLLNADVVGSQVEIIPSEDNAITVYQNQYDGVAVNKTGAITSKQLLLYEDILNDNDVVIGQTINGKIGVNYDFTANNELSYGQYISTLIKPQYGLVEDFQISSISVTALNTFTVNTSQDHGFTADQPIYLYSPRLDNDPSLYIASYASSSTTRTIGTGSLHNLLPGDTVVISNGKYFFDTDSEAFDGTFVVRSTPTTTSFTYLATTALTLATQSLIRTITNRQTSGGIATVTTSIAHGLIAGDYVYIYDLTENYNGYYEVTATPSTTQISYETGGDDEPITVDAGSLIITDISDWSNSASVKTQTISGFLRVLGTPTNTSFTISKSSNTATTSSAMTYPGNEVGINTFFTTKQLDDLDKTMEITDLDPSSISINLGDYSAYISTPTASSTINLTADSISSSNVTKEITFVSLSKAASSNDYPGLIMNYNGAFGGSLSTWEGAVSIDNAATGDAGYIYLSLPRREGVNYSYYGDITLNSEEIFLWSSKASVSNLDYQIASNIDISPDLGVNINNIAPDTRYSISNLSYSETRVPGYSLEINSSRQNTLGEELENKVMRFSATQIQVSDVYNETTTTLSIQPYGGTTAFGGAITAKGSATITGTLVTNSASGLYVRNSATSTADGIRIFPLTDRGAVFRPIVNNVDQSSSDLFFDKLDTIPEDLNLGNQTIGIWKSESPFEAKAFLLSGNDGEAAYYGNGYMYGSPSMAAQKVLYISGTGTAPDYRIGVNASTRRVKQDISNYSISDEKLNSYLDLDMVKYRYIANMADAQKSGIPEDQVPFQIGFIAEDAQDSDLEYLYQVDNEGIADYFAYEKMSMYHFTLLKRQQKQIEDLQNRLAALES